MLLCTLEVFVIGTCAASSRFVVAERSAWAPSTECGIKEAAEGAKTIPLDRPLQLQLHNYQMAPSKRGAGGGSATHKEPT